MEGLDLKVLVSSVTVVVVCAFKVLFDSKTLKEIKNDEKKLEYTKTIFIGFNATVFNAAVLITICWLIVS